MKYDVKVWPDETANGITDQCLPLDKIEVIGRKFLSMLFRASLTYLRIHLRDIGKRERKIGFTVEAQRLQVWPEPHPRIRLEHLSFIFIKQKGPDHLSTMLTIQNVSAPIRGTQPPLDCVLLF